MMYTYTMIRTNIYITQDQKDAISEIGKIYGWTMSAIVRKAVDEYCSKEMVLDKKWEHSLSAPEDQH